MTRDERAFSLYWRFVALIVVSIFFVTLIKYMYDDTKADRARKEEQITAETEKLQEYLDEGYQIFIDGVEIKSIAGVDVSKYSIVYDTESQKAVLSSGRKASKESPVMYFAIVLLIVGFYTFIAGDKRGNRKKWLKHDMPNKYVSSKGG